MAYAGNYPARENTTAQKAEKVRSDDEPDLIGWKTLNLRTHTKQGAEQTIRQQ